MFKPTICSAYSLLEFFDQDLTPNANSQETLSSPQIDQSKLGLHNSGAENKQITQVTSLEESKQSSSNSQEKFQEEFNNNHEQILKGLEGTEGTKNNKRVPENIDLQELANFYLQNPRYWKEGFSGKQPNNPNRFSLKLPQNIQAYLEHLKQQSTYGRSLQVQQANSLSNLFCDKLSQSIKQNSKSKAKSTTKSKSKVKAGLQQPSQNHFQGEEQDLKAEDLDNSQYLEVDIPLEIYSQLWDLLQAKQTKSLSPEEFNHQVHQLFQNLDLKSLEKQLYTQLEQLDPDFFLNNLGKSHQGIELFNSLNTNIAQIKANFKVDFTNQDSVKLENYRGIAIPQGFRQKDFNFCYDCFYVIDQLNDVELEFLNFIIKNRLTPTTQAELKFLLLHTVRFFYTLGSRLIPVFQQEQLLAITEMQEWLISQNNPAQVQKLDKDIEFVQSYQEIPIIFTFGNDYSSAGIYHYGDGNLNDEIYCLLVFNYKYLEENGWSYLIEIVCHEFGHWLDHQLRKLQEPNFTRNPQSSLFHSTQWLRLTQLAFNLSPLRFNSYDPIFNEQICYDTRLSKNLEFLMVGLTEFKDQPIIYYPQLEHIPCVIKEAPSKTQTLNPVYKFMFEKSGLCLFKGNLIYATQSRGIKYGVRDLYDIRYDRSIPLYLIHNLNNVIA